MLPIQEMDRINVKYAQVVIAYIIPDNIKWLFCWGKTGISEGELDQEKTICILTFLRREMLYMKHR